MQLECLGFKIIVKYVVLRNVFVILSYVFVK